MSASENAHFVRDSGFQDEVEAQGHTSLKCAQEARESSSCIGVVNWQQVGQRDVRTAG